MKRTKIGKGYWQEGYGRGFKSIVTIWEINGKAYAKDGRANPFQTDLPGYVMVNYDPGFDKFHEVGLIGDHKAYTAVPAAINR